MQALRDIAPYVAAGSAVLSLVLLIVVVVLMTRVARLRRAQTVVLGHHEQRDIVAHTEDLDSQVRNLREAVEILTDQLDDQKRHLDHALTNRAIIRYDAFRDAGGEQSASFALLDQYRSGVVFSAIAARDFARIYVKHISEGVADRDLSPEEVQAVEAAVPARSARARKARARSGRRCPRARRPRACAARERRRRARGDAGRWAPPRRRRRPRRSRRSATPWPPVRAPRRTTAGPAATRGRARPTPTTSPGSRRPSGLRAEAPPAADPRLSGASAPVFPARLPGIPSTPHPPPRAACVV